MICIELGTRVTDSITGFSGVATARTEYLYGCVSIEVQPEALHEGKPIVAVWFDEQRLFDRHQPGESEAPTGGPGHVPPPRKGIGSAEYFEP